MPVHICVMFACMYAVHVHVCTCALCIHTSMHTYTHTHQVPKCLLFLWHLRHNFSCTHTPPFSMDEMCFGEKSTAVVLVRS